MDQGAGRADAPVRALRRLLAGARNGLERRLHPRRHRRAREALRQGPPPSYVVFICLGNICRSPYAEARLRQHLADAGLEDRIEVGSAGFLGPGRSPPSTALDAARQRGLDLSAHRSRALDRSHLRGADLLVVMTNAQSRDLRWRYGRPDALHLGDLDPGPIPRRDILDPVEQPLEVFLQVYERIDRALQVMARELALTTSFGHGDAGPSAPPPSPPDRPGGGSQDPGGPHGPGGSRGET